MQFVMPFLRSTSYEADDFIRGEGNAQALDMIHSWPDWPYSIRLLHGAAGSGKTHLAHVFAARSKATFIDAARVGQTLAEKILVGNHAWILDDMHQIVDEAALAQLINHVRARGDYLLLTAPMSAAAQNFVLPDLRSRLLALPACALGEPDDVLFMGILAKQFSDRQVRITPELLQYAAQHIERSYEALAEFVRAMDGVSLAKGRALTVALVREVLREQARA